MRLGHIVEGLTASSQAAERVRREKTAEALQQRRLNLVLDLDHTLLNSTGDSRLALSIPERAQLLRILAVSAPSPAIGYSSSDLALTLHRAAESNEPSRRMRRARPTGTSRRSRSFGSPTLRVKACGPR